MYLQEEERMDYKKSRLPLRGFMAVGMRVEYINIGREGGMEGYSAGGCRTKSGEQFLEGVEENLKVYKTWREVRKGRPVYLLVFAIKYPCMIEDIRTRL